MAEFYRRHQDRSYKLAGRGRPSQSRGAGRVFISTTVVLATIYNWHNVGYGEVVAIHDSRGKVVQSYELSDLFQDEEDQGLRP